MLRRERELAMGEDLMDNGPNRNWRLCARAEKTPDLFCSASLLTECVSVTHEGIA